MLIDAPLGSGKTELIVQKYTELISKGISTCEILVLCDNSPNRIRLLNRIRERLFQTDYAGSGDFRVYTFNGVVRNSIANNWPLFENIIPDSLGEPVISPEMGGMGNSLFLMNKCSERADFSDYRSGINLMHQLLKRYTLIVHNNLDKEQIRQKSALIEETFSKDADFAIDSFKKYTLKYRIFDYLRQIDAFSILYKKGEIKDFSNIKYVLADNVDEFTYMAFYFLESLVEKADEFLLTFDSKGSSRKGYLCAYSSGVEKLKSVYPLKTLKRDDSSCRNADALYENLTTQEQKSLDNVENISFTQKQEMTEGLINQLNILLETNEPKDIKIVVSEDDEALNYSLKRYFTKNNIKYQFLSGTKRIYEDKVSFCSIIILLLTTNNRLVSKFEIKKLFSELFGMPSGLSTEIAEYFAKNKKLPDEIETDEVSCEKYKTLLKLIENLSEKDISPADKLFLVFKEIILTNSESETNFDKFNMLIKSLEEFYTLKERSENDFSFDFSDWLAQMRINIVSDNPPVYEEIDDDSIIISTAQKIIDYELKSKFQLWFDITNRNWIKEDTGTLYNSWVFQNDFDKDNYSIELHKELTLSKTASVLRKLMLNCSERIFLLNSDFDSLGNENRGELTKYLLPEKTAKERFLTRIIPRDDQKPVLDYKKGKMAVAAVPGAGKTTIMLALIMKLIEKGVNPSEILVLTYMESAASNFADRIRKSAELKEMPHISTIHGLAYKIIQDEDNYTRVGLNTNFEICDETRRMMILRPICLEKLPPGEQLQEWIDYNSSNISKAKSMLISSNKIKNHPSFNDDKQLTEFHKIYSEYVKSLKSNNLIDYDDLLILANELLENNSDIRKYYQNKFKFVIEDEAQDSSPIQQKLISILSEKHQNVVRCGDVNQSILSTFTNADVEGFKTFIKENDRVEMQSSQRCSKEIYELANEFMKESLKDGNIKNAFYQIEMTPVKDSNPEESNSVLVKDFEHARMESDFVISEIKRLQNQSPDYSCAILLRSNSQVTNWMMQLENNGINTLSRTETLKNKKVFRFLSKFLEFINSPSKNNIVQDLAKIFKDCGILNLKKADIELIKKSEKSFIEEEPQDEALIELWWELYYWCENSFLSEEEFIMNVGNYYFTKTEDISNVNLFCAIVRNFKRSFRNYTQEEPSLKDILAHLDNISSRPKLNGMKYFDDTSKEKTSVQNSVELMTIHKSKGDEFDIVFIPEMTDYNYNTDITKDPPDKPNALLPKLEMITGKKPKTKLELRKEQIEETLRLIYVGITRAKRKLYLSASMKNKNPKNKISPAFETLKELSLKTQGVPR